MESVVRKASAELGKYLQNKLECENVELSGQTAQQQFNELKGGIQFCSGGLDLEKQQQSPLTGAE